MDGRKIGELLKSHREAMGLSIQNVSDRTKIKRSYLESMEAGNFEELGNDVYVRNFARTYAKFLKISEPQILSLLAGEVAFTEAPPPTAPAEDAAGASADKTFFSNIFLAAAVCILLGGFFFMIKSGSSREAPSATPPMDTALSNEQTPTPDTAPAEHLAEMQAVSQLWLFWESESARFNKLMDPGEKQSAVFSKNLQIRAGNISGLKLNIDGKEVPLEGSPGKVYDMIFQVQENGEIAAAPPKAQSLRRFQTREPQENNP